MNNLATLCAKQELLGLFSLKIVDGVLKEIQINSSEDVFVYLPGRIRSARGCCIKSAFNKVKLNIIVDDSIVDVGWIKRTLGNEVYVTVDVNRVRSDSLLRQWYCEKAEHARYVGSFSILDNRNRYWIYDAYADIFAGNLVSIPKINSSDLDGMKKLLGMIKTGCLSSLPDVIDTDKVFCSNKYLDDFSKECLTNLVDLVSISRSQNNIKSFLFNKARRKNYRDCESALAPIARSLTRFNYDGNRFDIALHVFTLFDIPEVDSIMMRFLEGLTAVIETSDSQSEDFDYIMSGQAKRREYLKGFFGYKYCSGR